MEFILILSFVVIVVVAFHFYHEREEAERSKTISVLAQEAGYGFTTLDYGQLLEKYKDYKFSEKSSNPKIRNIITAKIDGINITLFEFIYVVSTGKSSVTYHDNVVMFPSGDSPNFILWPESLFEKLCSFLGKEDFDFELYPEFSSNYVLQGTNEMKTRVFFEKNAIKYFNSNAGHQIEIKNGNAVMVYTDRRPPKAYIDTLSESLGVWESIQPPSSVGREEHNNLIKPTPGGAAH